MDEYRQDMLMRIEKDVEKVDEEIAYIEHLIEEECIKSYSLPLNLDGNSHHPFYPNLKRLMKNAKDDARAFLII